MKNNACSALTAGATQHDNSLNSFKVFPDRAIPEVFWYQEEFRYSLSYQKEEAPLVFVIAGTGSSFYSSSMVFLQKILYHAGFHFKKV